MIVRARLKTQRLDGLEMTDAPIGKEYLVDLSTKTRCQWFREGIPLRWLDCVEVIDPGGGMLPMELLELIP